MSEKTPSEIFRDDQPTPVGDFTAWRKKSDWDKNSNHNTYIIGLDGKKEVVPGAAYEAILKSRATWPTEIKKRELEPLSVAPSSVDYMDEASSFAESNGKDIITKSWLASFAGAKAGDESQEFIPLRLGDDEKYVDHEINEPTIDTLIEEINPELYEEYAAARNVYTSVQAKERKTGWMERVRNRVSKRDDVNAGERQDASDAFRPLYAKAREAILDEREMSQYMPDDEKRERRLALEKSTVSSLQKEIFLKEARTEINKISMQRRIKMLAARAFTFVGAETEYASHEDYTVNMENRLLDEVSIAEGKVFLEYVNNVGNSMEERVVALDVIERVTQETQLSKSARVKNSIGAIALGGRRKPNLHLWPSKI